MTVTRTPGGDPIRLAQARKVDALREIGVTAKRACQDVGIPLQTYWGIRKRDKQAEIEKAGAPAKETGHTIDTPGGASPSIDASHGPNAARTCGKAA